MVFQKDGGLAKAQKLVEGVLKTQGVEPEAQKVTPVEGGAAWALERGSAAVMIALNPGPAGQSGRLRMISPIVKMPSERRLELYQRLLELNATEITGAAFGVTDDEVVLVAERSVRSLDRSEVEEMLAIIGHFADQYDDLLVEEFGGVRVCDLD